MSADRLKYYREAGVKYEQKHNGVLVTLKDGTEHLVLNAILTKENTTRIYLIAATKVL